LSKKPALAASKSDKSQCVIYRGEAT